MVFKLVNHQISIELSKNTPKLCPDGGQIILLTGKIASGKSFILDHLAQQRFAVFNTDCQIQQLFVMDAKLAQHLRQNFPECYSRGEIFSRVAETCAIKSGLNEEKGLKSDSLKTIADAFHAGAASSMGQQENQEKSASWAAIEIDRGKLANIIFHSPERRKLLEEIIYPFIKNRREEFVMDIMASSQKSIVLEIPLFFERVFVMPEQFYFLLERGCLVISTVVDKAVQIERALSRKGMTKTKLDGIMREQLTDDERYKYSDYIIDTSGSMASTKKHINKIIEK